MRDELFTRGLAKGSPGPRGANTPRGEHFYDE